MQGIVNLLSEIMIKMAFDYLKKLILDADHPAIPKQTNL